MLISIIIRLNLESRAKLLRVEGKTFDEIADILSKESKEIVSRHAVSRYFQKNDYAVAQVVECSNKLQTKVIEADIDTIQKRLSDIDFLLELAEQARDEGDLRTAIMSMRERTNALNCLDTRLGKMKPVTNNNTINILNIQEKIQGARESFISSIIAAASEGEERADII
jgi:multidrug efflux pump subunit AcrA (membrane-fusion protein)